jgi:hypothetical protein
MTYLESSTFNFQNGQSLYLSEKQVEHFLAHPEVTAELVLQAAIRVVPENRSGVQVHLVDLQDIGFVGYSLCLETDLIYKKTLTHFQFRPGRNVPSRVIEGTPDPTSKLVLCFKQSEEKASDFTLITAYAAADYGMKEPISPSIDPRTLPGKIERVKCLRYWRKHALIVDPSGSEPFVSTWEKVLKDYGNHFHK